MLAAQTGNHCPEQHERRALTGDLRPQVRLYEAYGAEVSDRADADASAQCLAVVPSVEA